MKILMIIFLFFPACHNDCKNFKLNLDSMFNSNFTPSVCFQNSECCKKSLLLKLNEKLSRSELKFILRRLGYFPEIKKKAIVLLKKNNYFEKYKSEINNYLNSNSTFKNHEKSNLNIKNLPISKMEEKILKIIMPARYNSIELIKKNNTFYIYVDEENEWFTIDSYEKITKFALIDFDNIIFSENKKKALLEIKLYDGISNYVFHYDNEEWKKLFFTGYRVTHCFGLFE